jgi:cytoskeletal protein CcmA (bactofilin family)
MFELGKKDVDANQAASAQRSQVAPAAGASSAGRSSGSGQFAVIGRSIQIQGDVKGDEDLVIEGNVSGTVELKNNSVTIGREGSLRANVFAREITVEGTTDGDLYASEKISIRASANVRGNLLAPNISLEDGARFKGSVEMDTQAVEKALGASQSKPAGGRPEAPATVRPNGEAKPAVQPSAAGAGN